MHRSTRFPRLLALTGVLVGACSSPVTTTTTPPGPVSRVSSNPDLVITTGTTLHYDATRNGSVFDDPSGAGLGYAVRFMGDADGLTATGGTIAGAPTAPALLTAIVTATDGSGRQASDTMRIMVFRAGLTVPSLPSTSLAYADAHAGLPPWYTDPQAPGSVVGADNTPADNPITDAGATLGRVLFYDPRLSANDRVSCSSCHQQAHGFADTAQFSTGFLGGHTTRHAMGLANARYYQRGRFFWDERAATLEAQALQPIQNSVEMGLTLDQLVAKLGYTSYYPALFQAAFGTPEITSDRIARALAQFVRSIVSQNSRFDQALASGTPPNFASVFTAQEQLGMALFMPVPGSPVRSVGCNRCHTTNAQVSDNVHNNGLDAVPGDTGAGGGRFKAPSLRNIAVRAPYMHDGRFQTLEQVIEHYTSGVQASPTLDPRLRNPDGSPVRLNLTSDEKAALVAFLGTLTDTALLTDPRFADPFPKTP